MQAYGLSKSSQRLLILIKLGAIERRRDLRDKGLLEKQNNVMTKLYYNSKIVTDDVFENLRAREDCSKFFVTGAVSADNFEDLGELVKICSVTNDKLGGRLA